MYCRCSVFMVVKLEFHKVQVGNDTLADNRGTLANNAGKDQGVDAA
jgi:hypothetical protein